MLDWLFGRRKEESPPQKPKPSAQQEAQDKWKYDFIVQFLSGPLWKTSILDFVDYHCVVFDSQQENKFQYTTIHKKFKQLVANLFDGMMQEVGLDDDKLAELLQKGFDSKHKKIFNQLMLADDFLKFKQLMVNRNKTLEAEAIKALQESSRGHKQHKQHKKLPITEEKILLESKKAQEERQKKLQLEEEEQLRKILELSKIEAEQAEMIKKLEKKVEEKEKQQEPAKVPVVDEAPKVKKQPVKIAEEPKDNIKVQEQIQKAPKIVEQLPKEIKKQQKQEAVPVPQKTVLSQVQQKPKKNLPSLEPLPPLRQTRKIEQSPIQSPQKQQSKPEPVVEQHPAQKVQVESQEDRKKRLLQQRERIRRKKEQERKKQMAEQEGKAVPVQSIVLQDDGIHDTHIGVVEEKKVPNSEIERRRELMKKIKNRIVDDF